MPKTTATDHDPARIKRLAAKLAFGADLARHARHLGGKRVELVHHGIDGVLQLEDFALDVDGDLFGEVARRHGLGDVGDVAHLAGEVRGHRVHGIGQIFPGAGNVFDIGLLAGRLRTASLWAASQPLVDTLPIGLFGASTGGGAALVAAATDSSVKTVVSRGGRVDLAGDALARVTIPVLMIVGSGDPEVFQLNRGAQAAMPGITELAVIPNAGHLFEEPGALALVGELASEWFVRNLQPPQVGR